MNNGHKQAVMKAAVIAGVALGVSATGTVANAQTPTAPIEASVSAGQQGPGSTVVGQAPMTLPDDVNKAPVKVSRISVTSGPQSGGTTLTVTGTNLATVDTESGPHTSVTFTLPSVKKGVPPVTAVVDAEDVEVLSATSLRIKTPVMQFTGKAVVTVTNGTKTSSSSGAPIFRVSAAKPQLNVVNAVTGSVTSDTGGELVIRGSFLADAKTKVVVGGKTATITANTGDQLTVTVPKGIQPGERAVEISTAGGKVSTGIEVTTLTPELLQPESPFYVSTQKGGSFELYGSDLQAVTGGYLTDDRGIKHKVTVKQAKGEGYGSSVVVTVPSRADEGDASLTLSTPYADTETIEVGVLKVGKPSISSTDVTVSGAGGPILLEGNNLHFIQSVKVGNTKLTDAQYYHSQGALHVTVPKQSRVPSTVQISVTTDGGTVGYKLTVTNSALDGASYDPTEQVITLNGARLDKLTDLEVTGPGKSVVPATFTVAEQGSKLVSAKLAQPLVPNARYTVSGLDTAKVRVSATFDAFAAPGTLSGAGYDADAREIVLSGTDLDKLKDVEVRDGLLPVPAGFSLDYEGVHLVASLNSGLTAGKTYTVTAKDAGGVQLPPVQFTAAAATALTSAAYDADTRVITLDGASLGGLRDIVVTKNGGAVVSGLTFAAVPNSTQWAATSGTALDAGSVYTVTANNTAAAPVAARSFTAGAAAAITSASYDADARTVSVGGVRLDTLTGLKVTGVNDAAVDVEFTTGTATAVVSKARTSALTPGYYGVTGINSANKPVSFGFIAGPAAAITSATYDADAQTVSVGGVRLDTLTDFVVTGAGNFSVDVAFGPGSASARTSAKLTAPLVAGNYTVKATNSAGDSVSFALTAAEATTTLAGATYDAVKNEITLSGTSLGGLRNIKVTLDGVGPVDASPALALNLDGTLTVSPSMPLAAGDYTVSASNSADNPVTPRSFTVAEAKGTLASASYLEADPQFQITLVGNDLGSLTNVKVSGPDSPITAVVIGAVNVNDDGMTATVSSEPLHSGTYFVRALNSIGSPVSTSFVVDVVE